MYMHVIALELCNKYYYICRLGLDPKVLMETVNSSSGRCWSSEIYCPVPGTVDNVPSSNDYKVCFQKKGLMHTLYDLMTFICVQCVGPLQTRYK
jgi:3-hydroxyisobutyrate dehydrogenase-like beta-hydroxyacid dehydrogenase